MIAKCRKSNTNSINGKLERAHESSFEEKKDDQAREECANQEIKGKEAFRVDLEKVEASCKLPEANALDSESTYNIRSVGKNLEREKFTKDFGIQLGGLSVGKLRTVKEARSFREKCKIKALNLALFPSSCAPPTLAHERIMAKVLDLPFVDQVWVDVNYKSYTKEGIEHLFEERLEMIKLVVVDKPGYDYCTLSKDTEVGENDGEFDTYFMVARELIGSGILSWVVGGDVIHNMVFWKERAKANLLQIDRLIICTRGKTEEAIEENLQAVLGGEEELRMFSHKVYYIQTTGEVSSTIARQGLCKILKVVSPRMLTYIISQPHVLEQYFDEFRTTWR